MRYIYNYVVKLLTIGNRKLSSKLDHVEYGVINIIIIITVMIVLILITTIIIINWTLM